MSIKTNGLAGSPSHPSKTRQLVDLAVTRAATLFSMMGLVRDLNDVGPSLGTSQLLSDLSQAERSIVDRVIFADALVIATPVYNRSHLGLFKRLFDPINPAVLAGKPVLLAATCGGNRHALIIEDQLRPHMGLFEAHTLATSVNAGDGNFIEGSRPVLALLSRLVRTVGQFAPNFPSRAMPEAVNRDPAFAL